MEHGLDDIFLGVERVGIPSGPEAKQDLLTHVDICHRYIVDLLNDE